MNDRVFGGGSIAAQLIGTSFDMDDGQGAMPTSNGAGTESLIAGSATGAATVHEDLQQSMS